MEKLIRAVVKAGIKSLSPILGSFAVDLADATAGAYLDARDKKNAGDVAGRVLSHTREGLQAWLAVEGRGVAATEPVFSSAEAIAGNTERFVARWSEAGFDALRAATLAMSSNEPLLSGFSDSERDVCRAILQALFSALNAEAKALEATEAEFRRQVLNGLADLGKRFDALVDEDKRRLQDTVRSALMSLPVLAWQADRSPPGALLRADIDDPVPFHGREQELDDLWQWCHSTHSLEVRLYTGPGGIGKTRLMRELVLRLRSKGWQSGFLEGELVAATAPFWSALAAGPEQRLFVIDYAETRRDELVRLLGELIREADGASRRVLLLARAADDWWDRLRAERHGVGEMLSGPRTKAFSIGPVSLSLERRQYSYGLAVEHFSRKLGRPVPDMGRTDLDQAEYGSTLLLHMAALAAIDHVDVQGDQGILHYILGRERRFWADRAAAMDLPRHLESGIGRMMAAITLKGGVQRREDALALSMAIAFLADQSAAIREAVVQLLHETYPGARWIEPILPDLLGEQLCQEETDDDPEALLAVVFDGGAP